jgi:hypothetical protein
MQKISAVCFWLLLGITVFSGCQTVRRGNTPLDYRDNLALPKGTVIKDVPFYVNGEGKDPTFLDVVTDTEGAYWSMEGQKAIVK